METSGNSAIRHTARAWLFLLIGTLLMTCFTVSLVHTDSKIDLSVTAQHTEEAPDVTVDESQIEPDDTVIIMDGEGIAINKQGEVQRFSVDRLRFHSEYPFNE